MVRTHLLQAFIPTVSYHYGNESHSINRFVTPLLMVASTRNSRAKSRSKPKPTSRGKGRQQQLTLLQPKQRVKTIPISEAKTMGEAIQLARTISDHLTIVEKFVWIPTDDNLKPHLRTQLIHNEKRKRWGSQLLEGIGQAALSRWEENPMELKHALTMEGGEGKIWYDNRLVRAIKSVALPIQDENNREDTTNNDREMVWISDALKGLHVLSGCIKPTAPSTSQDMQLWIDMLSSISLLIQSVDRFSGRISLNDAVEVRFAIRGLVKRLQIANMDLSSSSNMDDLSITDTIDFTIPNLNARTSKLPFDIFPHVLPWQMSSLNADSNYFGYPTQELLPSLLESIPFNFDTLTTRNWESVIERRGTAWLAEEGIGALAYSGKLMRPADVGGVVREIMRDIEQTWCLEENVQHQQSLQTGSTTLNFKWSDDTTNLAYEGLGQFISTEQEYPHHEHPPTFFDCALCNHYPDGESACKFHIDPEHGSLWHRTTAVISCGTSRMFAFRPIPDITAWNEWDNMPITKDSNNMVAAAMQLFPGDLVLMTGSCNDKFHHAVYSSPFDKIGTNNNSRVSLVLKRALDRKGKKGHGLKGEGRRSRRF